MHIVCETCELQIDCGMAEENYANPTSNMPPCERCHAKPTSIIPLSIFPKIDDGEIHRDPSYGG